MLLDLAACLVDRDLAGHLGLDPAGDEVEGVHVLQLAAGAQLVGAGRADGDVRVHTQRPLLHLRVRDAQLDDHLAQQLKEALRLLGRVDVGRGDDLDERRAATVVVDKRVCGAADPAARAADVRRLRGVLLEVGAHDPDPVVAVGLWY